MGFSEVSSMRCSISSHVPSSPFHEKQSMCDFTRRRRSPRSSGARRPVSRSSGSNLLSWAPSCPPVALTSSSSVFMKNLGWYRVDGLPQSSSSLPSPAASVSYSVFLFMVSASVSPLRSSSGCRESSSAVRTGPVSSGYSNPGGSRSSNSISTWAR